MSPFTVSSLLWLLTTAPVADPSASEFVLHEGLPEHFEVDGRLDEWAALPSFTLGAGQQVAGPSPVTSAEDLSARIWLALGPEGLAVAGEVRDDHVRLATKREQLRDDHVEVWLALPQPQMPAIGFGNESGQIPMPHPRECEYVRDANEEKRAACVAWWKQQVTHRKQLTGAFVTQYGLLSQTLVRYGTKDEVGRSHYEPMPGGYRFEALIPLTAFPRTAQAPLSDLQVMVDLIDKDEDPDTLETFLSSSSRCKFGDPSTFNTVKLATPLRLGAWPELFERLLQANPQRASYQPGPEVQRFQVWLNPEWGHQEVPSAPSPLVVDVDASHPTPVGTLGDVEVLTVPAVVNFHGDPTPWVFSRRGQQVLDMQGLEGNRLQLAPQGQRLVLLKINESAASPFGTGPCASCPRLDLFFSTMDAEGHFSKSVTLEDGRISDRWSYSWKASPDLSLLQVFAASTESSRRSKKLFARHTFDPQTGVYDTRRFDLP